MSPRSRTLILAGLQYLTGRRTTELDCIAVLMSLHQVLAALQEETQLESSWNSGGILARFQTFF